MAYRTKWTNPPWISSNGLTVKRRTSKTIFLSWELEDKDGKGSMMTVPGTSSSSKTSDHQQLLTSKIFDGKFKSEYSGLVTAHGSKSTENLLPLGTYRLSSPSKNVPPSMVGPSRVSNTLGPESLPIGGKKSPSNLTVGEIPSKPKTEDESGQWYEVQMRKTDEKEWRTVYEGFAKHCEVGELAPHMNLYFRMRRHDEPEWGSTIVAATETPPPTAEDLQRAVHCNATDMVFRIIGNTSALHMKRLLRALDKTGSTPLQIAALNGNHELVGVLLTAGSMVNEVSATGKTALMNACFKGSHQCIQLLDRNGADWSLSDKSGCNAIHHAINGGHLRVCEAALEKSPNSAIEEADNNGWTPLMRAVIVGTSMDIVKRLVARGANVNATDKNNTKSILMAACLFGKSDMFEYLLKNSADPLYMNANKQTVVTIAKSVKNKDILKTLKKNGFLKPPTDESLETKLFREREQEKRDLEERFHKRGSGGASSDSS